MIHHKDWDIDEEPKGFTENGKPITGVTSRTGLNDIEPDGSFVPCDMDIEAINDGVTTHRVKRSRCGEIRFTDTGSANQHLCKIKYKNGRGISLKYLGGDSPAPDMSSGRPVFNSSDGVQIKHIPYYKGVKIELIIDDPLTAPLEYPFSIKDYGQNYSVIEENGGLTIRGEDQEPIFIKAPFAVDANGDIGSASFVNTGIQGGYKTFKKVVDDETWLRQAAAPVRIDPDVTIEDGVDGGIIYDSFLNSSAPTVNYGSHISIGLHELIPGSPQPGIIYVSLTDYGDVVWLNGKFTLSPRESGGSLSYNVKVWRLLKAWTENTVTYNSADVAWQTPGAKGALDRASVEEATVSVDNAATDFPILAATLNDYWGGDVDNNGVLLEASQTGGYVHMHSSEGVGTKPVFYGEYTEAGAPALLRRGLGRGLNRGLGGGL